MHGPDNSLVKFLQTNRYLTEMIQIGHIIREFNVPGLDPFKGKIIVPPCACGIGGTHHHLKIAFAGNHLENVQGLVFFVISKQELSIHLLRCEALRQSVNHLLVDSLSLVF